MFRAKSQSYQTLLFRVVSVFWGICTHGQRLACNLLYFHHVFFWCCCWWVCAKFCYAADSAWVQQQGHAETGSWKQPAWRTVAKGQWCCWTGPGRGPVHAGQSMTRPNRFLKLSRLARGRWKLMRRLNAIQTLCGHWSAFCSPSILRVLFVASLFALKQFVAGGAKHLRSTSYLSFFAAKMFCFHKILLFLRFLWQRCQCTPQVVKILVAALCVTMCASTEVDWAAGSFAWNQCLKPRPRGFVYSLAWARSCCFLAQRWGRTKCGSISQPRHELRIVSWSLSVFFFASVVAQRARQSIRRERWRPLKTCIVEDLYLKDCVESQAASKLGGPCKFHMSFTMFHQLLPARSKSWPADAVLFECAAMLLLDMSTALIFSIHWETIGVVPSMGGTPTYGWFIRKNPLK